MSRPNLPALLLAAALACASVHAGPTRPDPTDAGAPVPLQHHRSSFTGYRALGDDAPIAWKDANETAARIGGWRAYAREARAPAPAASAASATEPTR